MSTYIVAVSGGVDSVALLHMLAHTSGHSLIVASFDHGIRDDSREDVRFVGDLAKHYGIPFETQRVELGPRASEERARLHRYAFLQALAKKYDGRIVTAHHGDDVVESIAINITRGTGWRGVATHGSSVVRPLLGYTKDELKNYARHHQLEWREDSTNESEQYLRNRLRKRLGALSKDEKRQLLALRAHQHGLKDYIAQEVKQLIGPGPAYQRYFFTHVPTRVALECLRHATAGKLTRPQCERLLLAVKTARPSARFEAGSGVTAQFTTRNFSLALVK
jgi:tRNA(Ile)-lysidine synthase